MTGKTHMAISTATVATALVATGVRASGSMAHMPPPDLIVRASGPYAIAGLLFLGMVAGLFPDLDAPDTQLQQLPRRAADQLGRYVTAGVHGRSPLAWLITTFVGLVALPFTLLVSAVAAVLRASTPHRGFTHTLLGAFLFTALAAGATLLMTRSDQWTLIVGAVWLLGYSSHLAADACTPSGIPLLGLTNHHDRQASAAPSRNRDHANSYAGQNSRSRSPHGPQASSHNVPRYRSSSMFHLLPRGMRVRTGTTADTLFIRWTAWAICAVAVTIMSVA
jgi:membrane-bound metal-dependent hydrolase YbcI (DUF457 family)